jgi:large subunit ribosomal protein L17e
MVKRIHLTDPSKAVSTQGKDLRVHYKNTYEVGKAIKGMLVKKAKQYLHEVLAHQRCIPYTKYDGSMGRTGQAIQFGLTKGRWPEKSVKIILSLLQNALANAEIKKLDVDKLAIKKVIVNRAMKGRRRTYRAHGRINAYLSSNCHVEIFCEETKERVKKQEKKEETTQKVRFINAKRHIRKALAKAYSKKKYVKVGGKK